MMWVPIVGLSISVVLTVVYLILCSKENPMLKLSARFIATMSYIVLALYFMTYFENSFNIGYMFIILGLIFALVADIALEEKDRPQSGLFLMKASAGLCVVFKLAFIAAFMFIIADSLSFLSLIYIGILGIFLMVLILLGLKYVLKLNLHGQDLNVVIYYLVAGFMTVLYIWYSILIPALWPLVVFAVLILINDILLININFGKQKHKTLIHTTQRLAYYISLVFLIYFIYFQFIGLIS
ncbi:MAG: hypothetical protein ACOX6H_04345 [Christensenellales bacterium]